MASHVLFQSFPLPLSLFLSLLSTHFNCIMYHHRVHKTELYHEYEGLVRAVMWGFTTFPGRVLLVPLCYGQGAFGKSNVRHSFEAWKSTRYNPFSLFFFFLP